MSSAAEPCPIWDGIDDNLLAKVMLGPQVCGTLRSGGLFVLDISGAIRLKSRPPTDRQKANLSYWIYHHNFRFWQFEWPTRQDDLLRTYPKTSAARKVIQAQAKCNRAR